MADCGRPDVDLSKNSAITDSLLSCHDEIVRCNLTNQAARKYIDDAEKRMYAKEKAGSYSREAKMPSGL